MRLKSTETGGYRMTKEETIEIKRESLWKGATFVFAVLFVISIFTGGFGYGDSEGSTTNQVSLPTAQQPPAPPQEVTLEKINLDDDAVKGDDDAKITIVEFSDFECPFCGKFFSETLSSIEKDFIDTGKAKLIFRDFPLPFHSKAQKSAEAAECAKEQGKFWELHDMIFENQQSLSEANLKKWAKEIGLSSKFDTCLDSGKYADEVKNDYEEGQKYGISGTPGFIIFSEDGDSNDMKAIAAKYPRNMIPIKTNDGNVGLIVSGALPYNVFAEVIEAL